MRQILLIFVATVVAGCVPEGNYGQDSGGAWQYMAVSPSGKKSPVFNSHDECAAYTQKHSDDFGTGTVIHRRPSN